MTTIRLQFLSEQDIQAVHDASLTVLRDTGIMVHHDEVLKLLAQASAQVDWTHKIARLPENLVMNCLARAGKEYIPHGRSPECTARLGYGDFVLMSSPGQHAWVDSETGQRRSPTTQDLHDAIRLGDALPHITIVGAMAEG